MKTLGIRRGWKGLLALTFDQGPALYTQPLDPAGVRTIDRSGGTVLHASPTNPGAVS